MADLIVNGKAHKMSDSYARDVLDAVSTYVSFDDAVRYLNVSPDRLKLFVKEGRIVNSGTTKQPRFDLVSLSRLRLRLLQAKHALDNIRSFSAQLDGYDVTPQGARKIF